MSDSHPIIVFDGDCVLCSASAQFVLRHDRHRQFRLTTAQADAGQALYRRFDLDPDMTMIVIDQGQIFTESDAALMIAARLAWPWRVAGVARIIPRWARNGMYRFVARNRYRWFGRRPSCWRPDANVVDRIL